jgi:hypothetical protein
MVDDRNFRGFMALSAFRLSYLDYVEGISAKQPSFDSLVGDVRDSAEAWVKSLKAAEGVNPYAKAPSVEELTEKLTDKISLGPVERAAYLLADKNPESRLRSIAGALEIQDRLRELLSKSVRVEVGTPEGGCRFVVGEDHVVAEWRGDGIAADTVFVEEPALVYGCTTTPVDRCVRMAMRMVHWEVVCAMLAGPGDGKLVAWAEKYPHGDSEGDDDE